MSSTSLPSTSSPDSPPVISETIHIGVSAAAGSTSTATERKCIDPLGAAIFIASQVSDFVVANPRKNRIIVNIWRDLETAGDYAGKARNTAASIVEACDQDSLNAEVSALAAQGQRVSAILRADTVDRKPSAAIDWPHIRIVVGDEEIATAQDSRFRLVARNAQEAADFVVIGHMLSERSLCGGIVQIAARADTFEFQYAALPDSDQLLRLVGRPSDEISCPTEYQVRLFGERRRTVPVGVPPHTEPGLLRKDVRALAKAVFRDYADVTGRHYETVEGRPAGHTQESERESGVGGRRLQRVDGVASSGGDGSTKTPLKVIVRSSNPARLARRVAAAAMERSASPSAVRMTKRGAQICIGQTGGTETDQERTHTSNILIVAGPRRSVLEEDVEALAIGGIIVIDSFGKDTGEVWKSLPEKVKGLVAENELRLTSFQSHDRADGSPRREAFVDEVIGLVTSLQSDGERDATHGGLGAPSANGIDLPNANKSELSSLTEVNESEHEISVDFYADPRALKMPATDGEVSDESLRRLSAFHRFGRDVGEGLEDRGIVPVTLHHYLSVPARGPYPICLTDAQDGTPESVTSIIDRLIEDDGATDAPSERTRLLLRMDAAIRRSFSDNPDQRLSEAWSAAEAMVLGDGDSSGAGRGSELLASAREQLAIDGPLLDCSIASHLKLIDLATKHEWRKAFQSAQQEADNLIVNIDEVLRGAEPPNEEESADHLRASVGKAFAEELDFDSFSDIVAESWQESAMSESRKQRLRSVRDDLRQLPEQLEGSRLNGVFRGRDALTRARARARRDIRLLLRLARAARIAALEIEGKYVDSIHDPLFASFSVTDLTEQELALCPPPVVDLGPAADLPGSERALLMDVLASGMSIRILLTVDDIAGEALDSSKMDPVSALPHTAWQAAALGTAYVFQAPASEGDAISAAALAGARFAGPALYSIYAGAATSLDHLNDYLRSAVALESRAFPAFEYNPNEENLADRFSIDANPAADSDWGSLVLEVQRDGEVTPTAAAFTFADFLMCDTRYLGHFREIPPSMWHESMLPIDEFMALDDRDDNGVPFLWAASSDGTMRRIVPTRHVLNAASRASRTWRTLQEMGGIANSIAEQAVEQAAQRLESEKLEAIEGVRRQYEAELQRATGEVARDIVSNIAAGLLGLHADTRASGLSAVVSPPPSARPVAEVSQAEAPPAPAEGTAPRTEEEEVIALDDPYVETARCTTCNECTNLNSRMFAYNDDQQAYIKDASAGTYRELVLAAEKCPVRIIHPGKPMNADEPGLDELIERAKPYL